MRHDACAEWHSLIELCAGGDLEPSEERLLERHLVQCAGCAERLQEARNSLHLVRSLASGPLVEEVPQAAAPGFWEAMTDAVLEAIDRPPARRSAAGRLLWFGTGFAAAASLLLLAWLAGALPSSPLAPGLPDRVDIEAGTVQGSLVPVLGPLERWAPMLLEEDRLAGQELPSWPEVPMEFLRKTARPSPSPQAIPAAGHANF